ncbi:hypothetical protein PGT21_016477 [Puccinia graminis f. sp. tritici]|uniref:Uncharacterized protein n=1 Tax=Puccinia graminis f. sp. tritici TaxID=56615 RepID=A0A5B0QAK7_PUCGR|nr:hypothetical protein PGT21_016477 [Puccinia graminis f. sp. tritici]
MLLNHYLRHNSMHNIKALRSEIDEISIPIFHEIKESVEGDVKPAPHETSVNPSNPPQQVIKQDPDNLYILTKFWEARLPALISV